MFALNTTFATNFGNRATLQTDIGQFLKSSHNVHNPVFIRETWPRGKQMIPRYTWQDFELKEPSTIENNVLEQPENDGILFFFHSSSRSLRFPETSVFRETPFAFRRQMQIGRVSPGCERSEGIASLRGRTLSQIPFIHTIFLYMHLSRPQYLDDFASKFSPWFDMVIVLLHLSKMHLVGSSVKEHLRRLKRNVVCCRMNIYPWSSQYTTWR